VKGEKLHPDEITMGVRSAFYRVVSARQDVMVQQQTAQLLQSQAPDKTEYLRGYIAGVMACQRIPATLRAEIEKRSGRK
jgi:hypothetical protein